MKSPKPYRVSWWIPSGSLPLAVITFLVLSRCLAQVPGQQATHNPLELEPHARDQIRLLNEEKLSRTPAQRKVSSQLLYLLRQQRQGVVAPGLNSLKPRLRAESDGRVLVDVRGIVSPYLIRFIQANGGLVVNSFQRYGTIRALIPTELTELLAQRVDVRSIRPAARATTSNQSFPEGGDIAHRAAEARQFFSTDGTGVKVGVLSDSIDGLTDSQAAGALPSVTILPGQAGSGSGEGTAMLEIVHALSPGSPLYFATAFNGDASFAQNIRDLQAAGCKIIIDDVTYFNESPFQDGPIAQAVNDVSAAGVLYFSAAGNSGGQDRGTSGAWEGDFKDAGVSVIGQGGHIHDFGGATYNTVLAGVGFERLDLTWSDPLGQSTNDYDVYVLDPSGNVVSSSADNQSGSTDPYEAVDSLNVGQRIVILQYAGTNRFLHLSTGRGRLTFSTPGATYGHNASGADNAFCVAATRVGSPPSPFVGGAANPVETFSSDGPRRVFYNADGSQVTPGDLSSTGGKILQKPDITAADGVVTTRPGFAPFFGTSAAAPHAGAIAALLWSYNPFLSPANIRSLLTGTALSLGSGGFDRNSGIGIVMAYPALEAAPQALLQSVQLQDANHNGVLDPNECADLLVTLHNPTAKALTGVSAVLASSTPQVFVDPAPRAFPDLQPNQTVVSSVPFHLSTGPAFVCGSNALFRLQVTTANLGNFPQPFAVTSHTSGFGVTNLLTATDVPLDIPDTGTSESGIDVSGIVLPLARVRVGVFVTHTYDQDLRISLVSPDNTEVVLTANNGQAGQNYGNSCQNRTYFSDDATNDITGALAPFAGVFTPEQPLSTFLGKNGAAVNGQWKLRVADQAAGDVGTIRCWSLELTPIGCLDGGGQCLSPPVLAQDLSDQVATNGSTFQFGVSVSGSSPLSYQWYLAATGPLAQQTNSTLILTNITQAQAGVYQVVITNIYGSVTSAPASLSVVVPARIQSNPPDQLATNGDTVTWNVIAQGTAPLSYQWFFNLTNALTGATNASLVLTNVGSNQTGSYNVVVANSYASVTSSPAKLFIFIAPTIECSSDTSVALDAPWSFTPPAFSDNSLTLAVVSTATNVLCGSSYSATRHWTVTATNGYQVACSQTVQVLDTTPPVLSCAADKTNIYGSNWSFDAPSARDAGATEALVYDNWTNSLSQKLDPGSAEVGNQMTLAGAARYPSRFAVEYWATNASQTGLAGTATAQVRFYKNDGPTLPTGEATPGTVLFDSGPIAVKATPKAALVLTDFQLDAAVPLSGALPSSFTWAIVFLGLGSQDAAGLNSYGPPVVGQAATSYWSSGSGGWSLKPGQPFGAQLAAVDRVANLSVLGTSTNVLCARSYKATRTWQALDACNNASTCSQSVTVVDQTAPTVLSQPQDQNVVAGQTVSLAVDISSCPPTSYQWFFNATNALAQGTDATLSLVSISLAQAGAYQVVITNPYGSVTSAPANITVRPLPTISSNPADQVVTNGDTVQWSVVASGSGALSYQWFFNGTNALSDQTNATLVLTNVSVAQAGPYTVVVTDTDGSTTSAPAQLQVLVLPVVVSIESSFAIPDPGTVTSRLRVSGMDLPLGRVVVGVHITHTFDADLRISLVSPDGTEVMLSAGNGPGGQNYGLDCENMTVFADAASNSIVQSSAPFIGTFRPQQSLSAFLGKSSAAVNGFWTLRVQDQAPPDSGTLQCWSLELDPMGCLAVGGPCLTAPKITQEISDQVVDDGSTVDLSVSVEGAQPLSYQWLFQGNALADGTNAILTLTNIGLAQAGAYQVVITNVFGSITGAPATLDVIQPAVILSGPIDQVATNGDTVVWNVVAKGAAPISFQWFFNSNALYQETNTVLTLAQVSSARNGSYSVVVSNVYGSVTSAPANLTVLLLPHIVCSPDTTVAFGDPWDFSPPAYSDTNLNLVVVGTITNALCGSSYTATRQWLVSDTNGYQVHCSQTVQVLDSAPPVFSCPADKTNLYGSNWSFDSPAARAATDVEALVYDNWTNSLGEGLDPGLAEVGNQVTLSGTQLYPSRFAIEYWGTNADQADFAGAVTAQVRFYGNDGPTLPTGEATPGTVLYDSGPLPINATPQGFLVLQDFQLDAAVPLSGALPTNFTWTIRFGGLGSHDAAGVNLYDPPVAGQAVPDYWALTTGGWDLLPGHNFGAQLAALNRATILTVLGTVTNATCARGYSVTRTWQAVDDCSHSNTCSQTVTLIDQSGPMLLSQPQDQVAVAGQTLSLVVGVATCPPTSYQWYFNTTNALTDETNDTLVLPSIGSGQAGTYEVAITNAYGDITSTPVTITVHVPAFVAGVLVDQVATNGDNVHWRALAKGTPPLFYQWFFNATNALAQQTDATLDLTNITPSQAGSYQFVVFNSYGSDTSALATLTVVVPPSIVSNPSDKVANSGDSVTFSVIAAGTEPLSYQWFYNNSLLGLDTNSSLVLSNLSPIQAGSYEVVVANSYGSVTSAPANLTIVVVPQVACASDKVVQVGGPWDFDPPTFFDPNLSLTTLSTVTNSICGDSYTATRQWVVKDTGTFELHCSQTVQVVDMSAPVFNCPADKTTPYGSSWSFDVPSAHDAGAVEALVYDNWTNSLSQSLDPGPIEVGNQVTLAGTARYPSRFAVEYWGTNASQASFVGPVAAQVRFYRNDGASLPTGEAAPGTVFFDSGPIALSATQKGSLVLTDFQLNVAVPLIGALPSSFTWAIAFSGLGSQDSAGLNLYGPPVVGQAAQKYWSSRPGGWTLQDGQNFGGQLAAWDRAVSLRVLSTVTNSLCARGYKATRTWQALDACNNTATCSQNVTVEDQSAPVILSQPQGQSALVGQTVSLSVDVSSCPPTSYQWYFNATNALAQGTSAMLVLTSVSTAQAGLYQIVVSNPYGSITSSPANVSISGSPAISTQPRDVAVTVGGTAVFTVSASGSPAPSYQWSFNETNSLTGATSPTLTLGNVQTNQAGFYSVLVNNSAGSVTSTKALLTVGQAPIITIQPQGITNFQGQAAAFTVTATGTGPLAYQWMANCNHPISGATAPLFRLKSVAPADSGTYCVTVSNGFGSVSSDPAVLRVLVQAKLISLSQSPNGVSLSFATVPSLYYSVYSSVTLPPTNWTLLPNMLRVPGTGLPINVQDPAATGTQRFYQIQVE